MSGLGELFTGAKAPALPQLEPVVRVPDRDDEKYRAEAERRAAEERKKGRAGTNLSNDADSPPYSSVTLGSGS